MREPPTTKQAATLNFIRASIEANGYCPSVKEICQHFGLTSNNAIHEQLGHLERKGWLVRVKGKARALRILAMPQAA